MSKRLKPYLVWSSVLFGRDEIPYEWLDLLVSPVGVEAVEQDDATGVLDQMLAEAATQGRVLLDDFPSAPTVKIIEGIENLVDSDFDLQFVTVRISQSCTLNALETPNVLHQY